MIVLDASALLAYLFREAGWEAVAGQLDRSLMSTVNLSEVLSRFTRDGHPVEEIYQALASSPIEFVVFTDRLAQIAAELGPRCRPAGLSFGDRACLALAIERDLPVLTADQAWLQPALPVSITVIR